MTCLLIYLTQAKGYGKQARLDWLTRLTAIVVVDSRAIVGYFSARGILENEALRHYAVCLRTRLQTNSVRLCKHDFGHGDHHRECCFAHELYELTFLPPSRNLAWKFDPGDRWIGQHLSQERIAEIGRYYHRAVKDRTYDIPLWAHGVRWYYIKDPPAFEHLPWDFGLIGDSTMFQIQWPKDLFPRLCARRSILAMGSKEP